jgi:hypothetical protein
LVAQPDSAWTPERPKGTTDRLASIASVGPVGRVATDGRANLRDAALVDLPRRFTGAHRSFDDFV